MLARNVVLSLSSAAILVGFIFLFVPLLGDACGNAFAGSQPTSYLDADVADSVCTSARVGRWMYVAPLLVGGLAALLGALSVPLPAEDRTAGTAVHPGGADPA